ncbi:sulfite exporter TauE/SafE family protein [Cytophagaceae bacterium ABcell3]|nr:sulfite exporter TauE/SafE family protein [Cytophagaceae bacterium ABcell3]
MEFLGYCLAILIGLSLGLIGGGGSILTVPVLVYIMQLSPLSSTAYSLFIVGITSLVGAIGYLKKGQLCYRAAAVFSIPSFIAVFATRKYLMPLFPDHILNLGNYVVSKQLMIMAIFSILMIASSYTMIRQGNVKGNDADLFDRKKLKFNYSFIMLEGAIVGVITGFVGAGGGFLIIPALVLLTGLPMKIAVGTSLLIIAAKSLIGFTGDLSAGLLVDWPFLIIFTSFSIIGIALGTVLSKKIRSDVLKPSFGWFTLILGIVILINEMF